MMPSKINKKRFFKSLVISLVVFVIFWVINSANNPVDQYVINSNMAKAAFLKKDYKKAVELYKKAEKNAQNFQINRNGTLLYINNCIASSYFGLHDFENSEKYFNKAINLGLSLNDNNSQYNLLLSYKSLASLYVIEKKYKIAEELYFKSLDISSKMSDPDKDLASIYEGLGILYSKEKDYIRAEKYLNRALDIKEELYGKNSPELIRTLIFLTALNKRTSHMDKAQILLDRINTIYKKQKQR